LDDFQNNAILLFYQWPYIHTCELEFDIFFLHWDMIDQNFVPNGYPYKFYASPPTIVSILFFDVITDKVHCHTWSLFAVDSCVTIASVGLKHALALEW